MPLHTGQRRAWLLHRTLTTAEITGSFQEWAVRGQGGTKQKVEPVSSVMGRSALSAFPRPGRPKELTGGGNKEEQGP